MSKVSVFFFPFQRSIRMLNLNRYTCFFWSSVIICIQTVIVTFRGFTAVWQIFIFFIQWLTISLELASWIAYFQRFSDVVLWYDSLWSCFSQFHFARTRDILILGSYLSNNSSSFLGLSLKVWVELKILQAWSGTCEVVMEFLTPLGAIISS